MDNRLGHLGFTAQFSSLNVFRSRNRDYLRDEQSTDISLSLDSPGTPCLSCFGSKGKKSKWCDMDGTEVPEHTLLALGLGCSSSPLDISKGSSATACTMSASKDADEESSVDLSLHFNLHLSNENMTMPKKSVVVTPKAFENGLMFDLQLSLPTGSAESGITNTTPISAQCCNNLETLAADSLMPTINYGSFTSGWNHGSYLVPSLYSYETTGGFPLGQNVQLKVEVPLKADSAPTIPDPTQTMMQTMKSSVACTSGVIHPQQRTTTKNCQFQGCSKGARGASGLCIAHGGGQRCQKAGCHKGAEGRTIYCKAHGGGRRCQYLGCTKSAEGRTDYCIAHGGGRRCSHDGCLRAARGKSGLCIRHGGGKRCQKENCTKSAEGYSGLCISHGGGRRCQFSACTKGAQGSTMFCKAHGGGKRCTALGCTKGAEGSTPFCKGHGGGKRCCFPGCLKSVHGGTQFCVAHGGGKRCAAPECTKSARGRTDYCVRHGGGKRCKSEGCGKSAQGSTDFCKGHGGGKRCAWGQPGSNFGYGDPPCERFPRSKMGLCAAHSALVQDGCVHGGGTLGPPNPHNQTPIKLEKFKQFNVSGDLFSKMDIGAESFVGWGSFGMTKFKSSVEHFQHSLASLPERRVHGGNLMAMLISSPSPGSSSGG